MLRDDGNPESQAYQNAQARAADPRKVYERREVDGGVLLVYHDFMNYKAGLAATEDVVEIWDRETGVDDAEVVDGGSARIAWPWEPEYQVPECCVDWE